MDRVARIIELEERISGEYDRWEQAELIAEELATGTTQRALAEAIGKSHRHVGYTAQVWIRFGNLGSQERSSRTFDSYYKEVQRGSGAERGSKSTEQPSEGEGTEDTHDGSQDNSEPDEQDSEQDKRTKLIAQMNEGMEDSMRALKKMRHVSYTGHVDTEYVRSLTYVIEEYTNELDTFRRLK